MATSLADQRDALIDLYRDAVPTLPHGENGVTHTLRPSDDLDDSELPHLFIGGYKTDVVDLPWNQEEITNELVAILYLDGTQDDALHCEEEVKVALNASDNLGGLVQKIKCRTTRFGETQQRGLQAIEFVIETVTEE